MFTLSRRLFALVLLCVPVVANAQDKTIRELTDRTPVVGDAMEIETAANASGFVLISEILTLKTIAVAEFNYPASSLRGGMAPDDSFPAALHDEGTNIDVDTLGYDNDTDECAGGQLTAPSDIDTSGTVTFRAIWYSGTATTGDVLWDFRHSTGQAEGASWDTALTIELATADTTQGTVDLLTVTTWTETVSNLSWVASDTVTFLLCRDADAVGDDMVGDAALLHFTVEVPRS